MSATSQGPGWWLASDGRWYPPGPEPPGPAPRAPVAEVPATSGSAPAVPTPAAPQAQAEVGAQLGPVAPDGALAQDGAAPRPRTPWELIEGVAAVLLVAAVLRFAGAIIATGIWGTPPAATRGQRLGLMLQSAFEFADGQGVLLLLAVLGLLWWQAEKWSERRWIVQQHYTAPGAATEVAGHLARTRRLLRCTGLLFALSALGGVALIAGVVFEYIGLGPWRTQWYHIAGSGSLEAAYVLVSVAGLVAVRHLLVGLRAPTQRTVPI